MPAQVNVALGGETKLRGIFRIHHYDQRISGSDIEFLRSEIKSHDASIFMLFEQ
jgi:hypothetical protein